MRTRPFAVLALLMTLLVVGLTASALAKPNGGSTPSGGGGGSQSGGSSPASGPAAPQATPLLAAFRSFYIVADGAEPNFNTFSTERIAEYLGNAFFKDLPNDGSVPKGAPPVYFVAAPGWTQDTLTTACQNDPNVVGGLILKYTSFYTEAFWIVYNAETQHITPSFEFISCNYGKTHDGKPIQAAPTINVFTQKSPPQVNIPLGPLAAIATLVSYNKASTPTAIQVDTGTLVLATIGGTLSGNVGVYNPGHEALGVANQIGLQATVITQALCNLSANATRTVGVAKNRTNLVYDLAGAARDLDQNANFTQAEYVGSGYRMPAASPATVAAEMNPGLDQIYALYFFDQHFGARFVPDAPKPDPPASATNVATAVTTPVPDGPGPLSSLCASLGGTPPAVPVVPIPTPVLKTP